MESRGQGRHQWNHLLFSPYRNSRTSRTETGLTRQTPGRVRVNVTWRIYSDWSRTARSDPSICVNFSGPENNKPTCCQCCGGKGRISWEIVTIFISVFLWEPEQTRTEREHIQMLSFMESPIFWTINMNIILTLPSHNLLSTTGCQMCKVNVKYEKVYAM